MLGALLTAAVEGWLVRAPHAPLPVAPSAVVAALKSTSLLPSVPPSALAAGVHSLCEGGAAEQAWVLWGVDSGAGGEAGSRALLRSLVKQGLQAPAWEVYTSLYKPGRGTLPSLAEMGRMVGV